MPRTPVTVMFYLNDIALVDDARQQATVDLALRLTWRDPRLEGRFTEPAGMETAELWTPRFAVLSDRTLEPRFPERVVVQPDGTVRYVQRFVGDVAFPMHLAEFPFDRQTFEVPVLFNILPDEAEFTADRSLPLAAPRFSLPGWSVGTPTFAIATGSSFSPAHYRAFFTLEMRRQRGYYVWTIFVPLVLVVAMGMLSFWIERNIEARVGLAATSILTLIALRFALSQMVPPLAYFTRMDAFVLSATVIVFLALVVVGATSYLRERGRERTADRLDRLARAAFPATFVLLVVASLWLPRR